MNFSSDLAGFVDRPISEMLDYALLDLSSESSLSPRKARRRNGFCDYTDARKRVDV